MNTGRLAAVVAALGLAAAAQGQICRPSWGTEFQPGDPLAGVNAQVVFEDGTGPKLYAAGPQQVWRWDGVSWVGIGAVIGGGSSTPAVFAMAVFDEDGSGPNPARLFVGGDFGGVGGAPAMNLAKYDGTGWSAVGGGVNVVPFVPNSQMVRALKVFDDGSGPALIVGGGFNRAGAVTVSRIAKWNGTAWSALGVGLTGGSSNNAVYAMEAFDEDGVGPNPARLIAGGGFTTSGATSVPEAARWTGSAWTGLATGLTSNPMVNAMAVHDDGAGAKLYFGGNFGGAQGLQSFNIIRWSGSAWSALPSPPFNYGCNGVVNALLSVAGEGLYVGGGFSVAGNLQGAGAIAKYSGGVWAGLAGGIPSASVPPSTLPSGVFRSLVRHDDGRGPAIFGGGSYAVVGGVGVGNIARWTGAQWTAVGQERRGLMGYAYVHRVLDAGDGPAIYMGGIGTIGALPVGSGVAKWDGTAWSVLGPRPAYGNIVGDLAVFDDGAGPKLYMTHDQYTTEWAAGVAKWTGSAWVPVGDPLELSSGPAWPGILFEFDDGSGRTLWSVGGYDRIGALPAPGGMAKLVNGAWQPMDFFQLAGQINGTGPGLTDLAEFGGSLYITGSFTSVHGVPAQGAARWTNGVWSAVGPPAVGQISRIEQVDLGTGPMLVGNTNTFPNTVYRLQLNAWVALGPTCPVGFGPLVQFDDGSGPMLYTAGYGTVGSPLFYRLRANQWEPLAPGFAGGSVNTMTTFDDRGARAPSLWLTGTFTNSGAVPAHNIARYEGCAGTCYANCDGSTVAPVLNVQDFVCFLNRFAAGCP